MCQEDKASWTGGIDIIIVVRSCPNPVTESKLPAICAKTISISNAKNIAGGIPGEHSIQGLGAVVLEVRKRSVRLLL